MISFAEKSDRAELEDVYNACFPGEPEYCKWFFDNFWRPERTLITRIEGRIAAAVHLLQPAMTRDGEEIKVMYIFAAATLPEHRGRGLMGRMLERSFELAVEWGEDISILMTENDSLFAFYERFGYQPVFTFSKVDIDPEPPSYMCKVRCLDKRDISGVYRLYNECIRGRAAICRDERRFDSIFDEYEGHIYGLFDLSGNMLCYALMDEEYKIAKEVMGVGCGYLLYVCSMDQENGYGYTLPTGENDIPVGCAKPLTEKGERFLSLGLLKPYLNILLN